MDTQRIDTQTQDRRDYGFVLGMLTGTFVGAGLAVWFAPRLTAEIRQRVTDSARRFGNDLVTRGQDVRDDVAGAVARGAHEVERVATAARSDRR